MSDHKSRLLQVLNEDERLKQYIPIVDILLSGYSGSEQKLLDVLAKMVSTEKSKQSPKSAGELAEHFVKMSKENNIDKLAEIADQICETTLTQPSSRAAFISEKFRDAMCAALTLANKPKSAEYFFLAIGNICCVSEGELSFEYNFKFSSSTLTTSLGANTLFFLQMNNSARISAKLFPKRDIPRAQSKVSHVTSTLSPFPFPSSRSIAKPSGSSATLHCKTLHCKTLISNCCRNCLSSRYLIWDIAIQSRMLAFLICPKSPLSKF